jgi:DNA-binding CsgD family transcriptional regulator
MGHLHARRLNGAEKAEIWRRWRQGESLQTIGRALGWVTKCVHYVVAGAGGLAPSPRRRSGLALTLAEREEISRSLAQGDSYRAVGRAWGGRPRR